MKKSLLVVASVFCLTACTGEEVAVTNESSTKSISRNACHNTVEMPNILVKEESVKMPHIVIEEKGINFPEPAPCSNKPKEIKSLEEIVREAEFL